MLGPLFVREAQGLPRRPRHYVLRTAAPGLLLILGVTSWQAVLGGARTVTLGDIARFGQQLFLLLVQVQLVVMVFLALLSAVVSVAQEKDRRTFVLLLLTDLRNHEIVLGKLFGSLLPVGVLLLATLPVWCLNLLLGGVAIDQVLQVLIILAAAGLGAGSVGCLVALWREQTFQALALTVLLVALYFGLVQAASLMPGAFFAQLPRWFGPYSCLQDVLHADSTDEGFRVAVRFALAMMGLSGLLTGWGIARLRKWNPGSEGGRRREAGEDSEDKDRRHAHAAPGRVRPVWRNPILWREVQTRAYGHRPVLIKSAYFLVFALLGWYALRTASAGNRDPLTAAYGFVPLAILGLLLVSAQAVTAITSERDGGALDLLLATDLSPREFIFGKLLGILYNAKEYLLPPLLLAGYYAGQGMLATPPAGHEELRASRNVAALSCVIGVFVVLLAFVTVLGVHVGLRTLQSRQAISHTLGTVFFLSAGTLICIYLILLSGRFEYQWGSFVLFLAAGIGGLWWVLNDEQPSQALGLASVLCPLAVLYAVMNVMIGKPGVEESSSPFLPALVVMGAFGFATWAMLIPLLSEFDVALGRTTAGDE